jgi:tyrosine-protein kinase Etk/Wzc
MSSDRRAALAEPEIPLLDLASVLAGRKRLIAAVALGCAALTAIVVFVMPPTYTAEAVILPPQADQSAQTMWMGSLAGLGSLGGLGAATGSSGLFRNPAELYIGVLKSRTIADALIARFRLEQVYGRRTATDTRKELERRTTITTGRDSLIRIRVDDHDRGRAAAIANAYTDELHGQNSRLAFTSAAQRRLFFERQLAGEKNVLADAEIALKNTQQANGLVFPPGQSEALIRSIAQLRAEIAAREVQLESMRTYATGDNPQVQIVERELVAMREQARALEAGKTPAGSMSVTARRLPEASLDYIRRLRDLKYHEALFEILAKQYEAARIDEARLAPVLQVVDSAVVPDKKSWPPRALLIFAAGCLGAMGAGTFVLVQDYRRRTNLAL